MVRMCNMMAFAAVIAAGTAASAADRVNGLVQPADSSYGHGSFSAAVGEFTYNPSVFSGSSCSCTWFNGEWDGKDGQTSHLGGGVPCGQKAADDFYLPICNVYDLKSITGQLLSNSISAVAKARLDIYEDCGGLPGNLLYTFDGLTVGTYTVGPIVKDDFRLDTWRFDLSGQKVVLKGGLFWVSIYGVTDGQKQDESYFATANNGIIRGAVAAKQFGRCGLPKNKYDFSGQPWSHVALCCIGCTDLAFTVCADACPIWWDNGGPDRNASTAGRSERNFQGTIRNSRAADDFTVSTCDDLNICYIEGVIYTNCLNFEGFYEIYKNNCSKPAYVLGATTGIESSGLATLAVKLYDTVIDGRAVSAYRLEFHRLNITLARNQNYWISLGVQATFNNQERGYFACNFYCDRSPSCWIKLNPGHTTVNPGGVNQVPVWTPFSCDFSFLIAGRSGVSDGSSTGSCAADFNRDGSLTPTDIFAYLNSYFAGCQ